MTAPDILSTMVAEPAPEQPDDVPMLNGREEAARIGRDKSVVSKARKDPTHPANADPRTQTVTVDGWPTAGSARTTIKVVPADAIDTWWAARPKKLPGPRPQRVYLAMAAKGETIPKRSRAKLIDRGLLGDDGKPTDAGLEVLAGDGATAQEEAR